MAYAATKRNMSFNGAAAYDLYSQSTAVRRQRQNQLPQDRPQARPQTQSRHQSALLTGVEIAAAAVVLLLVLFSQMKLYEATSQVSSLQNQLAALQEEQLLLRSRYDSSVDLTAIEEIAVTQLGMSRPVSGQTVYVNLSGTDRAEVLTGSRSGVFEEISDTVRDAFSNLGEYLS